MEWEHPDAKDVLHGLAWLRDTIKGQRRKRIEMVRQNDPFWDYVEKLDDGPFKCKVCGYKFDAATSISRFKWHLSGVKGRGVKICDKVPEQVSRRSGAGSSNNDVNSKDLSNFSFCRRTKLWREAQQGALEDWMDSITDKEIELMHDAFETTPRNRTSPASGER